MFWLCSRRCDQSGVVVSVYMEYTSISRSFRIHAMRKDGDPQMILRASARQFVPTRIVMHHSPSSCLMMHEETHGLFIPSRSSEASGGYLKGRSTTGKGATSAGDFQTRPEDHLLLKQEVLLCLAMSRKTERSLHAEVASC